MKILGIGIDLVKNTRMQNIVMEKYAKRFLSKFLHPQELTFYMNIEHPEKKVQFIASRWAVKEALNKAIGRK